MSISSLGLGSGLDLNGILDGLMKLEATQQNQLKTKVTVNQSKVTTYQNLNSQFLGVKTASEALNLSSYWKLNKATSTDASVTASAGSSAISGSLSFKVKTLATAQTLASFGSVASTDAVVGSGSLLLGQAGSLGLKNLTGTGLASGAHTIAVTQSSAGATVNGTPRADSITLNGSETLTYNDGGVAKSITLTAGTYTQQSLAKMISDSSGGSLNVTVNSDKSLKVATTREGSAASLQITGGSGLGVLGLTAGGVVNGTNGIVTVDGVANTVTDIRPDGSNTATLNSTAGSITASFQSGLRVGTSTIKSIDMGDGKLSTVVNNINAAGVGVNASAVQVAPGQFKLQLQSGVTGSAGAISTNLAAFSSTLGAFQTVAAAQDATLEVGTGAGAYTITSSSNTLKDVLPGVTLNVTAADPAKLITVSVGGDADGITAKVKALVTAANDALTFIKNNSKYDPKTKSGGPLLGNGTAARLQASLYRAISDSVSSSPLGAGINIGIKSKSDGTFEFDEAKFKAAYASNPDQVVAMFVEGGLTGTSTKTNPGIAERLVAVSKQATDSVSGYLTTAIKGVNSTIDDLNRQISGWDIRLEKRRESLQRQFSAMDTAIAGFKGQQNWLSGQISNLNAQS